MVVARSKFDWISVAACGVATAGLLVAEHTIGFVVNEVLAILRVR